MRQVEQELLYLQRLAMISADDPEYMSSSDSHALDLLIARKLWSVQDTWNEGRQLPPLNTRVQVVRFEDFCEMYDRTKCWDSDMFGMVKVPHQILIRRELADSYAPETLQMRIADTASDGVRDSEILVVLNTRDFMWRVA